MDEIDHVAVIPTAPVLWRMAETYADAAEVLITSGEPSSHQFDEPALHLIEQSIELALKGFLRGADWPPKKLEAFGHRLRNLAEACRSCGMDESFLASHDTIRVVDAFVALGKSGHGLRYPCNEACVWIEPSVALAVARRLLAIIKDRCTLERQKVAFGQLSDASI